MSIRRGAQPDDGMDQAAPGMAAEHALLGLLARSDTGISHGYDLARFFEPGEPLGSVMRIEPGMVYHRLKKLERLGWVDALPDTEGRPARRPIALTEAGRAELGRWLAEPVSHTREIRLEFLVKLYFALLLDPGAAVRLVAEQREICLRLIASLSNRLPDREEGPRDELPERRFGDMVIDMRLAQTEAALAWLDRVGEDARAALSAAQQR